MVPVPLISERSCFVGKCLQLSEQPALQQANNFPNSGPDVTECVDKECSSGSTAEFSRSVFLAVSANRGKGTIHNVSGKVLIRKQRLT